MLSRVQVNNWLFVVFSLVIVKYEIVYLIEQEMRVVSYGREEKNKCGNQWGNFSS